MNILLRRLLAFSLTFAAGLLGLVACSQQAPPPFSFSQVPPASLPYKLSSYQEHLIAQIDSGGGKVIRQGGRLQIILPTDLFFRPQTTTLKQSKVLTVNRVALLVKDYVAAYPSPRVKVSGYTDEVFGPEKRLELSQQYALVIASYLWNKEIPRQDLLIKGYGAQHPIAGQRPPRSAAFNRRVVVQVN